MAPELEKRDKTEVTNTVVEQIVDPGKAYSPDVDVTVCDDNAEFYIDIPGVAKGDVTIEVNEENILTILAKNSYTELDNLKLRQFRIGNYYRSFQISNDYDKQKISATLENGLLKVTLPKREEVKPKKIAINA